MTQPGAPATDRPVTFSDLRLSPEVSRALDSLNFTTPTPVQAATYEPACEGKDLIVQARTGTGKTFAFGLPLIDRLVKNGEGHQALVLAPTRELCLQTANEFSKLAVNKKLRTTAIYGGASFQKQVEELTGSDGSPAAEMISGTPGRVLDHIERGTIDASKIRFLVLDEADEMLSMGFAKELHAIIEKLPNARQTMMFSATVDDDVKRLAKKYMREPKFIALSGDVVGAQGIKHEFFFVSGVARVNDLAKILEIENPESAIIFCNTKADTESVTNDLQRRGFPAELLNGDLPQSERERVLDRVRRGEARYLVATDVAARGIDVSHLTHVINYTLPEAVEQYVHRTGRTGRAGRTGNAIALVGPQEVGQLYYLRLQYRIFPIERSLPSAREEKTRAEMDRIALLDAAFAGSATDATLQELAARLVNHERGKEILAGLLGAFFNAKYPDKTPPEVSATLADTRRTQTQRSAPTATATRNAGDEPPTSPTRLNGSGMRPQRDRPPTRERRERPPLERPPVDREVRADDRPRERPARDRDRERPHATAPVAQPAVLPAAEETRPPRPAPRRYNEGPTATSASDVPDPITNETVRTEDAGTNELVRRDGSDIREAPPNVYIRLGRKEGVRVTDIARMLRDECGLTTAEVGRIRVRERHSLAAVHPTRLDGVIATLSGLRFRDLAVVAEAARRQSGMDEEPGSVDIEAVGET